MRFRLSTLRFTTTLRELVWVVTIAAVVLGWQADRYRLIAKHKETEGALVSRLNDQFAVRSEQDLELTQLKRRVYELEEAAAAMTNP